MPYSREQCQYFAWASSVGRKVPDDWRKECKMDKTPIPEKELPHPEKVKGKKVL